MSTVFNYMIKVNDEIHKPGGFISIRGLHIQLRFYKVVVPSIGFIVRQVGPAGRLRRQGAIFKMEISK